MSSEANISPAPLPETPPLVEEARLQEVQFSHIRWLLMGLLRVVYRNWTRVAARLFPENSTAERLARKLRFPLPDSLNMNWITEHLAVGGRVLPTDIAKLVKERVTHVIDTRSEYCDDADALAREQIQLLHLPAPDTYPLTVEQLTEGARWAVERIQADGRVLIHCEHGVGRSVLLTCAVLVYSGMPAREALQLVEEKRWQAAPNRRQVKRLNEFESARRGIR